MAEAEGARLGGAGDVGLERLNQSKSGGPFAVERLQAATEPPPLPLRLLQLHFEPAPTLPQTQVFLIHAWERTQIVRADAETFEVQSWR
jgi:hypothetical protein